MKEYDNYYRLAMTILISDYKKAKRVYIIYDIKNEEMCVGIFNNASEIAEIFNTTKKCIYCTISKKKLRNRRFLIERIEL